MSEQAIHCFHLAFNFLALWFIWQSAWRRSCQERFRQRLFELRDELFDFARTGEITFTDPAYIALRSQINSLIRFSHRITVSRLATFIALQRYIGDIPQSSPSFAAVLSQIPNAETKRRLMLFNETIAKRTVSFLIFASPQIVIAGPILYILDKWIGKESAVKSSPSRRKYPIVNIIEVQARQAYKSEAVERDTERSEMIKACS